MSIPEAQLETWSHQGAVTTAKQTHEAIRRALASADSGIRDRGVDVYLQGSYKNDTNVRADSDVDVVVQLNSTFSADLSRLSEPSRVAWRQAYADATYLWPAFRADVLGALRDHFGRGAVTAGTKSLKVQADSGRLAADVVPCLMHRRYTSFVSAILESSVEGVKLWSEPDQQVIVNFPKSHYQKGVEKNSAARTGGWFKPVVRMFKNARTRCVELKLLTPDAVPSYFVECLVYNASDSAFGPNYQSTYLQVLDSVRKRSWPEFVCQNEQTPLFGSTPQQWASDKAAPLLNALAALWNHW